jgi:hypothetical protein
MKENTSDLLTLIKRRYIKAFRLAIFAARKVMTGCGLSTTTGRVTSTDREGSEDKVSVESRPSGTWRAALVHTCQSNRSHLSLKRKL